MHFNLLLIPSSATQTWKWWPIKHTCFYGHSKRAREKKVWEKWKQAWEAELLVLCTRCSLTLGKASYQSSIWHCKINNLPETELESYDIKYAITYAIQMKWLGRRPTAPVPVTLPEWCHTFVLNKCGNLSVKLLNTALRWSNRTVTFLLTANKPRLCKAILTGMLSMINDKSLLMLMCPFAGG